MKKILWMLVAAILAGSVAMPAMAKGKHANGTTAKKPSRFSQMDSNRDKKVSFEEFKAWHEAKKAAKQAKNAANSTGKKHASKNHAGKKHGKHLTLQQRFDKRDLNHDGSISKQEWKATKTHKHQKSGKGGAKS